MTIRGDTGMGAPQGHGGRQGMEFLGKRRKILCGALVGALIVLQGARVNSQKFYPDDPLLEEPAPFPTPTPTHRALSGFVDFIEGTFRVVGERHPEGAVIPASGVNTLGEVLDGPWYENRHGRSRLTVAELVQGPGDGNPPSQSGVWNVLTVKGFGARPGLLVNDARDQLYLLRFDPPGYLEMSTGAAMIASRFFHALGYHVPETYIVYFHREKLEASDAGQDITSLGKARGLSERDIDDFLRNVAKDPKRGYRALASRIPADWKALLGPFQMHGVRSDDPNDIVAHEHRRDLRGMYVFASWLNYTDIRAVNTMDVLVEEEGVSHIRHYWLDFSAALGSGGAAPKEAEAGFEPFLDGRSALRNTLGGGLYVPDWMRARYPDFRSVMNLGWEAFRADRWSPLHPLPPFDNRLPDDDFWAARQMMAFSDEDIRSLVSTASYSRHEAADWVVKCLMERRDRIGRFYFSRVLPLVDFQVEDGKLKFRDLEVEHRFESPRSYLVQWSAYDNQAQEAGPTIARARDDFHVPAALRTAPEGSYAAARIEGMDGRAVTVFLRVGKGGFQVVGLERRWPGKPPAADGEEPFTEFRRYADLQPAQRKLLDRHVAEFNRQHGSNRRPAEYFHSLPLDEQTTFDAITHALAGSKLTDSGGHSLGKAIDLIDAVRVIAGEDRWKRRDEQFRLYCSLAPGAHEILERAREFFRDHENKARHPGYPLSYRQGGNVPSLQFSLSRDGTRADIDIDYRSSGWPAALFNGHLSRANSDVRAGRNAKRHNRRWAGLIEWWQGRSESEGRGGKGADNYASAP